MPSKFSAIVYRNGGVFLFAGTDSAARSIDGSYDAKCKMVGWLLWSKETLELLELLNPKCHIVLNDNSKHNIISTGKCFAEVFLMVGERRKK